MIRADHDRTLAASPGPVDLPHRRRHSGVALQMRRLVEAPICLAVYRTQMQDADPLAESREMDRGIERLAAMFHPPRAIPPGRTRQLDHPFTHRHDLRRRSLLPRRPDRSRRCKPTRRHAVWPVLKIMHAQEPRMQHPMMPFDAAAGSSSHRLSLHPDRLFSSDPVQRDIARALRRGRRPPDRQPARPIAIRTGSPTIFRGAMPPRCCSRPITACSGCSTARASTSSRWRSPRAPALGHRPARGLAHARTPLLPVPRHALAALARSCLRRAVRP